ncbi:transcriptional regulator SUPERMAN-like [Dorcoceras hygrometricum]|nr:transcriptional regulator SUPERMAN-like [Dorcoceras hygrometricum]
MNVHRRDRARLRQFSPPKITDPNPSHTSMLPPFYPSSHFSSCNLEGVLKPSAGDFMKMETHKPLNNFASFVKKDLVRLDLEIGSFIGHGELDLELRLGYS